MKRKNQILEKHCPSQKQKNVHVYTKKKRVITFSPINYQNLHDAPTNYINSTNFTYFAPFRQSDPLTWTEYANFDY
jgi:hypothetical protein